MKKIFIFFVVSSAIILSTCNDNSNDPIDSDVYVKICSKIWMKKNLDVDHYRNGDLIPEVRDSIEWSKLKTGAWCYYNNESSLGKIYGKLYNWYAVNDPRGLAPEGWHVPSLEEWEELNNCLGGQPNAGGKLKSTGTIEAGNGLWIAPNFEATNESGFSAVPGGTRNEYGRFNRIGLNAYLWSSTENTTEWAWLEGISGRDSGSSTSFFFKVCGYSVRCIKD